MATFDRNRIDRECAMMILLVAAAERLLNNVELELHSGKQQLRHEAKQRMTFALKHIRECKEYIDRVTDLAMDNGRAEDGSLVGDAYLEDTNVFLRHFLMLQNALHGEGSEGTRIKLEDTYKLWTKDPVFPQEFIDELTAVR